MKQILRSISGALCLGSLCLGWSSLAHADSAPTLVIQVPASFYQHPVRLLHPYINYWHDRAEAAATVGISRFEAQHFNTASCQAEAQGQALVVIEPNLFYNPQTGIFYSEISARVYTQPSADSALGKPLLSIKGEGQSRGWLSYNVEYSAQQSYAQAFDQVIRQLQQHPAFQQSVSQAPVQTYQALCQSIDTLSQPKAFF